MKNYTQPVIELLLFDEEEILAGISANYTNAAENLNKYMFSDDIGAAQTTTIKIETVLEQ